MEYDSNGREGGGTGKWQNIFGAGGLALGGGRQIDHPRGGRRPEMKGQAPGTSFPRTLFSPFPNF